jgi:hypothetical protein
LVRKPRLNTPTAVYMHATSSDSWMARWLYICCTGTSSGGGLFCSQQNTRPGTPSGTVGQLEVQYTPAITAHSKVAH